MGLAIPGFSLVADRAGSPMDTPILIILSNPGIYY